MYCVTTGVTVTGAVLLALVTVVAGTVASVTVRIASTSGSALSLPWIAN